MADTPPPEDVSIWQQRLAAQANNRAWQLSESRDRSAKEDEEMLQAAHAAMYFWKIVGTDVNRARAAQLLAHVYALLKLPNPARHYLAQSESFFLERDCEPCEKACALAIKAGVAAASGQSEIHAASYREAERLIAALPEQEDRDILFATLRVVPEPVRADRSAGAASALNSAEVVSSDDDFRSLERTRLRALVARDVALAEALHSPQFHLVTPGGKARSRKSYLDAVRTGDITYLKWEADDIVVRRFGNIVLLRYQAKIEMPVHAGGTSSFSCWHTDSYELHDGFWRVVWSQATRIAAPADAAEATSST